MKGTPSGMELTSANFPRATRICPVTILDSVRRISALTDSSDASGDCASRAEGRATRKDPFVDAAACCASAAAVCCDKGCVACCVCAGGDCVCAGGDCAASGEEAGTEMEREEREGGFFGGDFPMILDFPDWPRAREEPEEGGEDETGGEEEMTEEAAEEA